ncbi:hypothetical protein RJT34_24158 [Clitoria ternatea]|uniref:Uncharacterized protein n=1 Tax=Clitoria ternatea TaxID=43366 RepID=A0AAN9IHS9_CLITE
MEREKGVNVNGVQSTNVPLNVVQDLPVAVATANKKAKIETEKKVEVEEPRKEKVHQGAKDGVVMGLNWEEHMPWVGGLVDEQMSWAFAWFPWWDMDFMSEADFSTLFSDIVWEDDIWDLKNKIPIPLGKKKFDVE